jgi:non-specific serine/threonine protein kinase/serine/threonine-protein kinase
MASGNTWDRIEQVFDAALSQPPDARAAWVQQSCADDPQVCEEVLRLLRAHAQQGEFLQAPLLDFKGQAFGPYIATEEVGRGGMSVVYRGRRADGDFDKEVAIKVVLVQTTQDLRQSETQILASLEHPRIARLLDAGRTELGFRYLLMEFVEGRPITTFAATLGERARLRLFLDVCDAVRYAHQSLVVHRDLKPDNILVNADGQVKLLDFGIAKILDPEAGIDQTQGVRAFSPNYASPEQLLGQPVTTATDVYSLGVLLCELMAGRPPRQLEGLTIEKVVDEARRSLRELPLKGDLGSIARKALQAEPSARYDSAGALARDVERYLRGLPIEAREPTWAYRAGRFIARHRYSVSAASLAVAGLVAALAFALWQAQRAELRFNQVRELARAVMFELHDEVRELPGSLTARKVIVDQSLKYLDALAADPSASPDVQLDLARGYLRLAEIEGKDFGGISMGRSKEALQHSIRAVDISRRLLADVPADPVAKQTLVDSLEYATTSCTLRGEMKSAIRYGEEAVRLAEELVRDRPASENDTQRLATVSKQLADVYAKTGQRERGIPLFERNLALRELLYAAKPEDTRRQQRLAEAHQWLGSQYWFMKNYAKCELHTREAIRLDELRAARNPRAARANLASGAMQMGMLALQGKRHEEAIGYIQRALSVRREISREDPRNAVAALRVAAAVNRLGVAYREWNRFPEAIRYGREALFAARKVHNNDPKNMVATNEVIFALSDLALTYDKASQHSNACQLAREATALGSTIPTQEQIKSLLKKMQELAESCQPARH